ncbi:unnamed protein product [Rotaria magnacalcarata]|uniref:MULE transposase domain-containing protein n=2 Tax=Rotaria magnacalcarata TaxID=392030 RepID=A0A816M3D2_9BILA|nr:unnamed protein product [Rotaria magnacalcarata]
MNQGGRGGTLSSLDPERRVNGSAATVPIFDAWRSTLYSIRKTTLPTVPTSIDSITIPDIMSFTHSHEQFLFCNTNAQHKIIAFTSESALKILSKNHHWNVDGTFGTAPSLFSQAYYIHVSEETYVNLYQSLVQYATKKNVTLNPTSILNDFEQSAINAINQVFPRTVVKCCHFHSVQNIWKKVKKYSLTKLSKQQHIRTQIANIISLPLVPKNEINNFMEHIIDVLSNIDSKFDKLTDYVIIKCLCWRWSRTNNHLEDWHRQLIARIRVHPDLWTWFNEIKSSEESVMIRHEQEQAQQRTTRPKKAINIRDGAKLKAARLKYLQDQDFDSYRKVLCSICHRYIDVLSHSKDSSDEE